MKENLTPAFEGRVKPARDGVYQRQFPSGNWSYALFKNGIWRWARETVRGAASEHSLSQHQGHPWRGLAEPPKS